MPIGFPWKAADSIDELGGMPGGETEYGIPELAPKLDLRSWPMLPGLMWAAVLDRGDRLGDAVEKAASCCWDGARCRAGVGATDLGSTGVATGTFGDAKLAGFGGW